MVTSAGSTPASASMFSTPRTAAPFDGVGTRSSSSSSEAGRLSGTTAASEGIRNSAVWGHVALGRTLRCFVVPRRGVRPRP